MDSFEWNKIAGWALASGVAVLGLMIVSDMTFHTETPEKPGYAIDAPEETAAGPVAAVEKPIAFYLASADAAKGAASFKKCAACHTITKRCQRHRAESLWHRRGRTCSCRRLWLFFGDGSKEGRALDL